MHQVPGKKYCEDCIAAEPQALGTRDWKAVKFFIKNKITALKQKYQPKNFTKQRLNTKLVLSSTFI